MVKSNTKYGQNKIWVDNSYTGLKEYNENKDKSVTKKLNNRVVGSKVPSL